MSQKKAFPLRLEPALYEALRRWADSEFRSVNGQIEYLLQQAVDQRKKAAREGGPKSESS